jgi:hypothetical protein
VSLVSRMLWEGSVRRIVAEDIHLLTLPIHGTDGTRAELRTFLCPDAVDREGDHRSDRIH